MTKEVDLRGPWEKAFIRDIKRFAGYFSTRGRASKSCALLVFIGLFGFLFVRGIVYNLPTDIDKQKTHCTSIPLLVSEPMTEVDSVSGPQAELKEEGKFLAKLQEGGFTYVFTIETLKDSQAIGAAEPMKITYYAVKDGIAFWHCSKVEPPLPEKEVNKLSYYTLTFREPPADGKMDLFYHYDDDASFEVALLLMALAAVAAILAAAIVYCIVAPLLIRIWRKINAPPLGLERVCSGKKGSDEPDDDRVWESGKPL